MHENNLAFLLLYFVDDLSDPLANTINTKAYISTIKYGLIEVPVVKEHHHIFQVIFVSPQNTSVDWFDLEVEADKRENKAFDILHQVVENPQSFGIL